MATADSPSAKLSILLLSPSWLEEDKHGIVDFTRSLGSGLHALDPKGENMEVTCAVVQEEGRITKEERLDAKKVNVKLAGARVLSTMRRKKVPKVSWLDTYSGAYYRHLTKAEPVDFIVGHIPYLADGAFNIKELCNEQGYSPQVVLIMHARPKTASGEVDEPLLMEWLKGADLILSIGQEIRTKTDEYLEKLDASCRPQHDVYVETLHKSTHQRFLERLAGMQCVMEQT